MLNNNEFRSLGSQESRDYCVIAAYNKRRRNVTRTFASDKKLALGNMNHLEPPALYDKLRTKLPFEETLQYVAKVSGYRKQAVGGPVGEHTEH